MEIEFNTTRMTNRNIRQIVGNTDAPSAASVPATSSATTPAADASGATLDSTAASLQNSLNGVSSARPDKVSEARQHLADSKFPPNYVLDRIATLLALNLQQ
jgi:hypothetical protein